MHGRPIVVHVQNNRCVDQSLLVSSVATERLQSRPESAISYPLYPRRPQPIGDVAVSRQRPGISRRLGYRCCYDCIHSQIFFLFLYRNFLTTFHVCLGLGASSDKRIVMCGVRASVTACLATRCAALFARLSVSLITCLATRCAALYARLSVQSYV